MARVIAGRVRFPGRSRRVDVFTGWPQQGSRLDSWY